MFDKMYGDNYMYVSKTCDGSNYGGVTITFHQTITYVDIIISTRSSCCRDGKYGNVCLYGDGEKLGCTPADIGDPGSSISFKDYTSNHFQAKEFRLNWENNQCAQIEELVFYYMVALELSDDEFIGHTGK